MDKICNCDIESALFVDGVGVIRCQYCCGRIIDEERIRKYIDYNTPIKNKEGEKEWKKNLNK